MSRASRPSAWPSSASDAGACDDLERVGGRGAKKSRCRRAEVRERDARIARPLQDHARKVLAGDRERIGSQLAMDGAEVAAIAFEEDAVAAWRAREDCRLRRRAGRHRPKETAGAPGRQNASARGSGPAPPSGWPSPPCSRRRRAGTDSRVQAKAEGRSVDGVCSILRMQITERSPGPPATGEKQAQFTRLARPLSCCP